MRSVYISHIGMTEPLGQSQVLPYLTGLARAGVDIEIVSFEAAGTTDEAMDALRRRLAIERIAWRPLRRSEAHGLAQKALEGGRAVLQAIAAALRKRPDIVHARSYLPAAVADVIATLTPGARMLFDCRGMLADEYVDNGNWRREQLEYRLTKRVERRLFARTDGLVVLTEALAKWLREQRLVGEHTRVQVIPCCADTGRFVLDEAARERGRRELGLGGRTVVVYAGTLGSWYLEREMARFVAALKRRVPDVALVVLSRADATALRREAREAGLADEDVLVKSVAPSEMPAALAVGDLGLSFIQPCFSKLGSSPTKVAEYLASGLGVVLNDGVGDQGELAAEESCVVLRGFAEEEIARAAARAAAQVARPWAERAGMARRVALARLSLTELAIPRYLELYRSLA